jgi:hypothetical protein
MDIKNLLMQNPVSADYRSLFHNDSNVHVISHRPQRSCHQVFDVHMPAYLMNCSLRVNSPDYAG